LILDRIESYVVYSYILAVLSNVDLG